MAPGEVHCWCASVDVAPEVRARLYATLSSDERERSARFRFERDRRRFIVAHGALREVLGRYLQVSPGRIRYAYNAFGKPGLGPGFGSRLGFNLSHSAGLALIAVAVGGEVGVDIECVRAQSDYAEIAQRYFSAAEVDQLTAVRGDRFAEAFIGCWTKKEAYLKARGVGIAGLSVSPPDDGWSLHTLQPAPGYVGALAVEGSGRRVSERRWTA